MENNHINEDSLSKRVRLGLEQALETGEPLLEYLRARVKGGAFSSREVWIGLTDRRMVFIEPGRPERASALDFELIWAVRGGKSLEITAGSPQGGQAASDTLRFTPIVPWQVYLDGLVEKYRQASAAAEGGGEGPGLTVQRAMQQAADLRRLGAGRTAAALQGWCLREDPYLRAELEAKQPKEGPTGSRLALRLAAGMYGLVGLYLLLFLVQGEVRVGYGLALALAAIAGLWRGPASPRLAIAVLLTVAANIFMNDVTGSGLEMILWGSFALGMGLLLVGRPGRVRMSLGGLVFLAGWVGGLGFSAQLSHLFSVWGQEAQPFSDDFSASRGWALKNEAGYAVGLEDGSLFMKVNAANTAYYVFPPLNYYAERAEVDVSLPAEGRAAPGGGFGLVCRYQPGARKYYAVYFDPLKNVFAVGRQAGDQTAILTSPAWQSLSSPVQRIGLACQANSLTVLVNGLAAARISDPQMAQFGEGPLGLLVTTWAQAPAEGFKVLFDNASFWPVGW